MSVELAFDDAYAILALNRPQARNALNFDMLRTLIELLDEVAASNARGLVIAGVGDKAFCAGADIKELMGRSLMEQREGVHLGQRAFEKLAQLNIPSVAVIHGYAFGGGLELAMACTFRIGTEKALMGLPEIKLGLIPGYGGTQRLPRLVGPARALELVMSGRSVDAHEAERWGLLNRIVPEGNSIELGRAFLAELIGYSLCASCFAREAVMRGIDVAITAGLEIEADLSTLAYRTEDATEGMRAFIEKRAAKFKDA